MTFGTFLSVLLPPIFVAGVFAFLRRNDPSYGLANALNPVAFGWAAGFAYLAFTA